MEPLHTGAAKGSGHVDESKGDGCSHEAEQGERRGSARGQRPAWRQPLHGGVFSAGFEVTAKGFRVPRGAGARARPFKV